MAKTGGRAAGLSRYNTAAVAPEQVLFGIGRPPTGHGRRAGCVVAGAGRAKYDWITFMAGLPQGM